MKTYKFLLTFMSLTLFGSSAYSQWSTEATSDYFRIRNNTSNTRYFQFTADPAQASLFTNLGVMRFGITSSGTVRYPIELQNSLIRFRINNVTSFENTSNYMYFRTNDATRLAIVGHRIGINTQTPDPEAGVHIHQRFIKLSGIDPLYTGYGGPTMIFAENTGNNGNYAMTYNVNTKGLNFWKPFPAVSGPNIPEGTVMFLSDQGNVGLRTYNPTATLTVNGTVLIGNPSTVSLPNQNIYGLYVQKGILAEKLKIALHTTSDWSDFVFAPNYRLRPLCEVQEFIATNGHLPDMPSAETLVEEGGYDVLQMDALLLMKIEELTLYMLELQKRNEELAKRLAELEAQKQN